MLKKNVLLLAFFLMTTMTFSQNWITDFEDAKVLAIKNDLNIVLVFQGSDWCGPCIKLDKQVWSTHEFRNLAKDHFVMLKADFPRRKSNQLVQKLQIQNNKLAEQYNEHGYFPLAVLLNVEGAVLGKMGYKKLSPLEYFNKLKSFE